MRISRHIVFTLLFIGHSIGFSVRTDLPVAIVAMVDWNKTKENNGTVKDSLINSQYGERCWLKSRSSQGNHAHPAILQSFGWYVVYCKYTWNHLWHYFRIPGRTFDHKEVGDCPYCPYDDLWVENCFPSEPPGDGTKERCSNHQTKHGPYKSSRVFCRPPPRFVYIVPASPNAVTLPLSDSGAQSFSMVMYPGNIIPWRIPWTTLTAMSVATPP